MDTIKYINMVYNNKVGIKWWNVLQRPDIWTKWCNKVKAHDKSIKNPEDYARRIVIEALWHFGYAQDYTNIKEMTRCARRLRRPPERGAGDVNSRVYASEMDFSTRRLPWELQEFDDFLEYHVRPLVL